MGWLSGSTFSLREVGLDYLPGRLKRPAPGDAIQEIPVPLDECGQEWLPRAVELETGLVSLRVQPALKGVRCDCKKGPDR